MAYIIDMDVVLFTPAYPHSRIHSSLQNVTLQARDVNNYLEIIVYDMNLQKDSRELCYFIVGLCNNLLFCNYSSYTQLVNHKLQIIEIEY